MSRGILNVFTTLFSLDNGFTGFSNLNFEENLKSEFTDDVTFFVVFGVFFPTACGVFSWCKYEWRFKRAWTEHT